MCFCLIYSNLDYVSSCIDMYLGIFVNRIEVEVEEVEVINKFWGLGKNLKIKVCP